MNDVNPSNENQAENKSEMKQEETNEENPSQKISIQMKKISLKQTVKKKNFLTMSLINQANQMIKKMKKNLFQNKKHQMKKKLNLKKKKMNKINLNKMKTKKNHQNKMNKNQKHQMKKKIQKTMLLNLMNLSLIHI